MAYITELLALNATDAELFKTFLPEDPPPRIGYSHDDVRLRYYEQALILVETKELIYRAVSAFRPDRDGRNQQKPARW
jgi:hypothetical protein